MTSEVQDLDYNISYRSSTSDGNVGAETPLLHAVAGSPTQPHEDDARHGETFDNVPKTKRQLGIASVVFLIFNHMIGTGIYATPSIILREAGSIGVTFIMWILGAAIAGAGTAVYIELGTGLPRSGGEKNYLEFIYRQPKYLITCAYIPYIFLMGLGTANSTVFSEYLIESLNLRRSWINTRLVAFTCLTFIVLIHGTMPKWGVRLQNILGMFKLAILSAIVVTGLLCLFDVPGFKVDSQYEQPHNFKWEQFWEGSGTGINAFVMGLYNVMWSFVGYSAANYALSEVKNPIRTIKRAASASVFLVAAIYLLINVAYFAVVSKHDVLTSQRIIAALFFRNLFGSAPERVLSAFVALSVLGALLASQFVQGRAIQELGREGILPCSSFFASDAPFNAPINALFAQYLLSLVFLFVVPPGDIYQFIVSLSSYCSSIVNTFVSLGLLLLYTQPFQSWNWRPPFKVPKAVVIAFFLSNLFLIAVPFIPPTVGTQPYEYLPYWSHPIAGFSVSIIGVAYWYYFAVWEPRRRGFRLERQLVTQNDGITRYVFIRDPCQWAPMD